MTTDRIRAISTVADVTLALVVCVGAIAVLGGFQKAETTEYDPSKGPHTTETVGASTLNVTYSLEPVIREDAFPGASSEYDESDLQRVIHGSMSGQIAAGTVANISFETDTDTTRLSVVGGPFQTAIEDGVQARLVESNFHTNLSGYWTPFENASVQATMAVGQEPPVHSESSLTTLTVPSGFPSVRTEAIEATQSNESYAVVAELAAEAIVSGLFPELDSQHALESSGLQRDLIVYRYRRMASVLDGTTASDSQITGHLARESADARALNAYLTEMLAGQLETEMRTQFATPQAAAKSLTLSELTIVVRTWEQ